MRTNLYLIILTLFFLATSINTSLADNPYVPNSVTIDKTKAVGEIPFTSGVSASGAMTYTVPIEIYPGINGFQPQIALSYNSQAGNGIMGFGWNIAGLSTISRTTKNIYYNGLTQGIFLNKADAFVLDGMRLVKLGEKSNKINYKTEQGNIKVNAILGEKKLLGITIGHYIKYFEVFYPNGNKAIYGKTFNISEQLYYSITSLIDIHGNSIDFTYRYTKHQDKIDKITYGGASNASIEFQYTSRQDNIPIYSAGLEITEDQLLEKIICKFGNTTLRTYELQYQTQSNSSVLSQIDLTALGSSLNPLKFYYGEGNIPSSLKENQTKLSEWHDFYNPEELKIVRGKFEYGTDDDGILSLPYEEAYYSYYEEGGLFSHSKRQFQNHYKGDEKIFIYTQKNLAANLIPSIYTEKNFVDLFCADLDGKQEEEIIKVNNGISGKNDQVIFTVYTLKSGAASLTKKYTRTFNFSTIIDHYDTKSIHPKIYFTGDFNGDGKMEVLAVSCHQPWEKEEIKSKCYLFDLENNTILYEGDEIPYYLDFPKLSKMNLINSDDLFVIDYNGDGKSDLCLMNDEGIHIYTFSVSGSSYALNKVNTDSSIWRYSDNNKSWGGFVKICKHY
jgi:hypothetical protein